jgi:hypothetical protein
VGNFQIVKEHIEVVITFVTHPDINIAFLDNIYIIQANGCIAIGSAPGGITGTIKNSQAL